MTSILPDFNKALNWGEPAVGSGASSIGTTIFVLNNDAKVADSYDDPTEIVNGAGTGNDKINPIVVPSMGYNL